jgi:hypothetical protein
MTIEDASLLLAVIGGTSVLSSWLGRRTGDAARDAWLMLGVGACLLTVAAGIYPW